jgi:nitroreductase
MKFIKLAKKRYSCRKYQDRPVELKKLEKILEAGRVAPTAVNYQPQKILVVQTPDGLAKVEKAYKSFGAPLALIVCVDHNESWKRPYDGKDSADTDAAIVATHMMLCAADLGIDSVWVQAFDPTVIREEFRIPENIEPMYILMLGYSSGNPRSPDRHDQWRKPISETVFYESF